MAKLLAVTIVIIAILSAIPIITHKWPGDISVGLPQDISTHGALIDEQFSDTMLEAGIAFLASQLLLAFFIWKYSNPKPDAKVKRFPGGATGLVLAGFMLVGTEVLALGVFGAKAWGAQYFTPPAPDAVQVQVQAQQFAFYFRYPGPDGKFGPIHPNLINEAEANFFGLDTTNDQDSKDDIVTAEIAVPVNREVHLLMHSRDLGHSFYVPELRVHQDFVPGLDLSLHFTATKIGKYEIACTQLCGLGHYAMTAYLEVMSESDYENWLKQQAALQ
jgi:cytochrome c oxidase subunit 2